MDAPRGRDDVEVNHVENATARVEGQCKRKNIASERKSPMVARCCIHLDSWYCMYMLQVGYLNAPKPNSNTTSLCNPSLRATATL